MDTLILSLTLPLVALCFWALWFYGYGIYAAIDYLTHADVAIDADFHPKLTLLLRLDDFSDHTYVNLQWFCQQTYPCYQIVVMVPTATVSAVAIVEKLIQQFPERDIRLASDSENGRSEDRETGTIGIWRYAATETSSDLCAIAHSNLRVETDYLQQLVQPFRYPGIGVVTCPSRSQARGLAILAALGTATEYHAAVLLARRRGRPVTLSSTIAIRKALLTQIHNSERIADIAVNQDTLGCLAATHGYRMLLSHQVVAEQLMSGWPDRSGWHPVWQSLRSSQAIGARVAYGTVISACLVGLLPGVHFAWILAGLVWLARLALGWIVGVSCLQDATMRRYWWLIPFYDLLSCIVQCGGWLSDRARGQKFDFPQANLNANLANLTEADVQEVETHMLRQFSNY